MTEGKEKEGEKIHLSKEGKREKWKAEGREGGNHTLKLNKCLHTRTRM